MVATRRSTRSQGTATPAASPATPPAPAPKRQTRGKAKAASPTRDESPSKSPNASSIDSHGDEVTPSKRRITPATKRASPATRKKSVTPVKEVVTTPVKENESKGNAEVASTSKSAGSDADKLEETTEVVTTPAKELPKEFPVNTAALTETPATSVMTSSPTPEASQEAEVAVATPTKESPKDSPVNTSALTETPATPVMTSSPTPEASKEATVAMATPTKVLRKQSPVKKATPSKVTPAMSSLATPDKVTPREEVSSPPKAATLSETDTDVNGIADAEDDDDVEAMVNLALSSFAGPANPSCSVVNAEAPMKKVVSNRLDSGVATRDLYMTFNGNKAANGAQLASERKIVEELKQFAKTQKVAAIQEVANSKAHATKTESGKNQTSSKWFNMVSNELTAEAKRDIQLIKMRNYLDPKRFYKSSDLRKSAMPKVFQVGTVIEGAAEFKSARLSRKQRHQTFTEEILHDKQIGSYTKRKYGDIQASKANHGKNKFKKAKHQANRK
ncbi:hypothetical protein H310_08296 [Aphanomyces invadans]|uniref:Fcf2 pre-rRNA processing C-terminal domain-containing protein n=1 Tax=Aphanomyces invadans TaxID=157072 RepID=A0A024TYT5_9STRA|nr:hypothetical protein H310_08296 [Aphanomyces invadans]ETV98786.1 hypothetical protein H310_08296 [Aphanomyces invadans]|eukprot:XP_008872214.1 hypothetical protein H310_08296 [Aphanomyces invadans]